MLSYQGPQVRVWLASLLSVVGFLGTLEAQQPTPSRAPHRLLVNQYCAVCHNDSLRTAGLALDTASTVKVEENAEIWEKVVRKLRARQMPPVGLPRPDETTYDTVVSSLETLLDSAAEARPNPGRTDTFRRLT